jgi:Domain of unknown function (DUF4105)
MCRWVLQDTIKNTLEMNRSREPFRLRLLLAYVGQGCVSIVLLLATVWAAAALFFDVRMAWMRILCVAAYLAAVGVGLFYGRSFWRRVGIGFCCFLVVLGWWLTLKPPQEADWQADVSRTAWGDVNGDAVTIHNLRLCDYRAEFDYTCQWRTRQVNLADLRGMDLFLDYWGSPWIAHTIISFDFGNNNRVAFSIEARKRVGQQYSAIRGFFRQFTLISIVSDERDVVELRTNYRKGEDLYLYHTTATKPFARELFRDYIAFTNHLHAQPEWYNAVTRNCTTQIFDLKAMKSQPLNWAVLFNGKGDAMEYRLGNLAADGLSFEELKRRAYINPAARAADHNPDFSALIRKGRPGFGSLQ